jgi:glycosyltransferase involved in cell wall biosynthesis
MNGGGAERQLAYLAGALRALDWDVHVALLAGGPNLERLRVSGAEIHRLRARHNYDPTILGQLIRVVKRVQPDVVETWMTQMDILGGLAAKVTRVPWILRERGSERAYPASAKHRCRVIMARGASAVISNSQGGDRYWERRLPGRVQRYVVANALPLEEIDAALPVSIEESGIGPGERLVLYVGRLLPGKNVEVLVSALRLVVAEPRVMAVLCGEGPQRPSLLQSIDRSGLAGRVRLAGYVPNVWAWLKRADAFVSISLAEGQPNTVMEAMAAGCPVIASDIPAHREFLDEESAVLVKPDVPEAVAEAITGVLAAHDASARRSARARATATAWSIAAVGRRHADIYRDVLMLGPERPAR